MIVHFWRDCRLEGKGKGDGNECKKAYSKGEYMAAERLQTTLSATRNLEHVQDKGEEKSWSLDTTTPDGTSFMKTKCTTKIRDMIVGRRYQQIDESNCKVQ